MIVASFRPIRRAGSRNSGSITSATSVICQDSVNIAASVRVSVNTLPTMLVSVEVKTCCAPSTSLFRRLTSAPVCVRVKNGMGIRWMCANTFERMSKIRPSPTRAEQYRSPSDSAASITASPATTSASVTTTDAACRRMPSLMTARYSSGFTTPITESTASSASSSPISRRYGRANEKIRRTVPFGSFWAVTDRSCAKDRMECHVPRPARVVIAGLLSTCSLSGYDDVLGCTQSGPPCGVGPVRARSARGGR